MISGSSSAVVPVLWMAILLALASRPPPAAAFSIDTQRPIVRSPPGNHMSQEFDLFGYQGVLHSRQAHTPTTSTDQALMSTVIIVGAPNGTADQAVLSNTGVLFECPLTPGPCRPFVGDGTSPDDRRLYDTTGNGDEVKEGQRLGTAMDSTGDRFIVCGHRYRHSFFRETGGLCFVSGRDLAGFTRHSPCFDSSGANRNRFYQNDFSSCAAGTSVSLLNNGNIVFGAPATSAFNNNFRGASIIFNSANGRYHFSGNLDPVGHTPTPGDRDSSFLNSYSDYHRGYSTVRAHIFSNNPSDREDLIVGMPRGQGGNFMGAIGVHRQQLETRSETRGRRNVNFDTMTNLVYLFEGSQIGSYFGGTVAAVDVNNDGFDEVIAAAPLYASSRQTPEGGVVVVYVNSGGSLSTQNSFELVGPRKAYARFGHAITGLGDINGDGFNDVAISAPFGIAEGAGAFSGAVYIYAGSSSSLQANPLQVIEGSSLNLLPNILENLSSFGSSLFSYDVDNNGFQDLLVGAFQSRKMFVLRTRPVLNVISSILPNITSVNDTSSCVFESTPQRCFSVEVCIRTTGRGFPTSRQFNVEYNLTTDSRVFFGEGGVGATRIQGQIGSIVNGASSCNEHLLYLAVEVLDFMSPLAVGVAPFVSDGSAQLVAANGNEQPTDLADRPAATVSGLTQALVLTNLECGEDNVCNSDLTAEEASLSFLSRVISGVNFTSIVVSQVTDLIVSFDVYNRAGDNAYQPTAVISYSTAFGFSRIEGISVISCMQAEQGSTTVLTCDLGALIQPGAKVSVAVRLVALEGRLRGTEGTVTFNVNVTSNSEELSPGNNVAQLTAVVTSLADIHTTMSSSASQFIAATGHSTEFADVRQLADIGRQIQVNITATNFGPSTVGLGRISVQWPLAHRCSGDQNFVLYLASIRLDSLQGSCTVSPQSALDYFKLSDASSTASESENVEEDQSEASSSEPPSFINSTHPFAVASSPGGAGESGLDCASTALSQLSTNCGGPDDFCVSITCDVRSHAAGATGVLAITGYIDDEFFASQPRDWNVVISANYTILDSFVTEITGTNSRPNDASVSISVLSQSIVQQSPEVPIWVIVVPIVLGLLFIVIIVIILYCCGFFKRRNWKKLKEEEEQNANGNENSANQENGNETSAAVIENETSNEQSDSSVAKA
nr:integrin alpha 8 [Halisarca dujardinii]